MDQDALIFDRLQPILAGFSAATPNNVTIIISLIADAVGQRVADWIGRWVTQKSDPTEFMRKLLEGHNLSPPNYRWVLDHFSTSERILTTSEVEGIVAQFLKSIRPALLDFITRKHPLNQWVPDPKLPHAEFLRNLNLPALPDSKPDMLLHNLGSFLHNPVLLERLLHTFPRDKHTARDHIVINTSGSGKTRLLLEGLCLFWGLYFTSLVDSHQHGSYDLENAIAAISEHPGFTEILPREMSAQHQKQLKQNQTIARQRIREVVVARMCILEEFCRLSGGALKMNDGHKKRWLLLQLQPFSGPGSSQDIFAALAHAIRGANTPYLQRTVPEMLDSDMTRALRGEGTDPRAHPPGFFCIIDEAQSAATTYPLAFRSHLDVTLPRPVLREAAEIIRIPSRKVNRIIAGTGMSGALVREVLASSMAKETASTTATDLGGFDDPTVQKDFMRSLLPDDYKDTPSAERLYERASRWLHGRFRFTTAFMRELLANGYQSPHRLLDAFIASSTSPPPQVDSMDVADVVFKPGFTPTDGKLLSDEEPPLNLTLTERSKFNFKMIQADKSGTRSTLQKIALKFLLRSDVSSLVVTSGERAYMESGVARLKIVETSAGNAPTLKIDEPIVILSLLQWFHENVEPTQHNLMLAARAGLNAALGGNALEEYWAYYFTAVFTPDTPLDVIFTFAPDATPSWAKKSAKLVSIYGVPAPNPSGRILESASIGLLARPSATLGIGGSKEQTLAWLDHQFHEVFCFPDKVFGPDIMFVLELHNGKRIWVAFQSKYASKTLIDIDVVTRGIDTVKPSRFFHSEAPKWNSDALQRLDALPNRLNDGTAGPHSVLRAIGGWPGRLGLHSRAKDHVLYKDDQGHPIAEINITHFSKVTKALHPGESSTFVEDGIKWATKRKSAKPPADGRASKRRKGTSSTITGTSEPPATPTDGRSLSPIDYGSDSESNEEPRIAPSDDDEIVGKNKMAMPTKQVDFGYLIRPIKPAAVPFLDNLYFGPTGRSRSYSTLPV
ncbi:hypothetical protein C8R46DRAFT_1215790 [Mycena filopes]|nr:hypothetical protein C8R46DRAFT_1215790 [Mycena filopes]